MSRFTEVAANDAMAAAAQHRWDDHVRQARGLPTLVEQVQAAYSRGVADGRMLESYERFGWSLLGAGVVAVIWWAST